MSSPIQPTIPIFHGNGYEIWSAKMRTLFISEDLWELVDKGHVEEEMSRDAFRDVGKKDARALFIIQQAIAESIFPQISKATTSKEAWDALQTKYKSTIELAAQDGDGDGSSQADIIAMDDFVYKAAATGDIQDLKKIPESEILVQLSPMHNTVIHIACEFGQSECMTSIFDLPSYSSSLLQRPNLKGDTPLHLAARDGHFRAVEVLLESAKTLPADIETGEGTNIFKTTLIRMTNKRKNTALHEAVRFRHSDVVKLLIEEDPEFTYGANESGITPLYMAAERRFTEVVKIIIDKSATSPLCTGFMGRTALHAAVTCNDQELTETLVRWKPELTKEVDKNGWSPLHCAAERGCDQEIVKLLLENSEKSVAYLGTKDGNKTALHIAFLNHHEGIVNEILNHFPGCREQVDEKGNNVFHFAIMRKGDGDFWSSICFRNKWLRSRGLVNEKDAQGNTPLHLLSSYRNPHAGALFRLPELDMKDYNNENLTAHDIILKAKEDISAGKDYIKTLFEVYMPERRSSDFDKIYSKERRLSKEYKEKRTSELRKRGETHLIVSALITTVTFAAGFTLPGGYNGDDGNAILSNKAAFKAFVVTDTIAMVSSLCAVFLHFFMTMRKREKSLEKHLVWAFIFTMVGMGGMAIAFATGLYAVLPHSSTLALLTCILCSCFFLSFIFEYAQNRRCRISYKVPKIISTLKKKKDK